MLQVAHAAERKGATQDRDIQQRLFQSVLRTYGVIVLSDYELQQSVLSETVKVLNTPRDAPLKALDPPM